MPNRPERPRPDPSADDRRATAARTRAAGPSAAAAAPPLPRLAPAAVRPSPAGAWSRGRRMHVARVRVAWLDPDLLFAHCMDATGHRYVADARSAVSLSALSEGMEIDVLAYPSGLVKALVFAEDEPGSPGGASKPVPRREGPCRSHR